MILSSPVLPFKVEIKKIELAIGIIWLFQLSAILGISVGFQEWFISKTPLNLTIHFLLLMWTLPNKRLKEVILFSSFLSLGMLIELIGVKYGWPFGTYTYGQNLGVKIGGVPLLIGCNWGLLVFITASITDNLHSSFWIRAFFGAALMLMLDIPMEIVAPEFDFWKFEGGHAPIYNFVAWFVVSFILQSMFHYFKVEVNRSFSIHLYLAQIIFFTYFAVA